MMKSSSFIPLFSSSSSSSHTLLLFLSLFLFLSSSLSFFSPILRKPIHRVKEGSLEWNYESGEPLILSLPSLLPSSLTTFLPLSLIYSLTFSFFCGWMIYSFFLSFSFYFIFLFFLSFLLFLYLNEERRKERKENKVEFLK